jgi:hypothetical protein
MSQKVPIRMPVGSPASAFLSTSAAPAMPVPRPPTEPPAVPPSRPPVLAPPQPPSVVTPAKAPATSPRTTVEPREPQVRFQVYLPQSLAVRIDAEIERRKAAGKRGRGKSDYSAIFRELVDRYL